MPSHSPIEAERSAPPQSRKTLLSRLAGWVPESRFLMGRKRELWLGDHKLKNIGCRHDQKPTHRRQDRNDREPHQARKLFGPDFGHVQQAPGLSHLRVRGIHGLSPEIEHVCCTFMTQVRKVNERSVLRCSITADFSLLSVLVPRSALPSPGGKFDTPDDPICNRGACARTGPGPFRPDTSSPYPRQHRSPPYRSCSLRTQRSVQLYETPSLGMGRSFLSAPSGTP